jgi:hypothetical protein
MAANEAQVSLRAAGGAARSVRLVDLPGHPRLRGLLDDAAPSARALVFLVDGRDGVFLPAVRETAECVPGAFSPFSHRVSVLLSLVATRADAPGTQAAAGRAVAPGAGAQAAAAAARSEQNRQRVRRISPVASCTALQPVAHDRCHRRAGCHSVHFVRKRLEKEMCVALPTDATRAVSDTRLLLLRSEALRAARGTLAEAGGSSAAARDGGAVSRVAPGAPFSFDAAGLRVTAAGISVAKDDVDAVRAFATSA